MLFRPNPGRRFARTLRELGNNVCDLISQPPFFLSDLLTAENILAQFLLRNEMNQGENGPLFAGSNIHINLAALTLAIHAFFTAYLHEQTFLAVREGAIRKKYLLIAGALTLLAGMLVLLGALQNSNDRSRLFVKASEVITVIPLIAMALKYLAAMGYIGERQAPAQMQIEILDENNNPPSPRRG